MAKKRNKKSPKQELVDTSFSFSNVPKVGDNTVLNDSLKIESPIEEDLSFVKIQFNIHPDYVKKFYKLKAEYSLFNENFDFNVDKMFSCGVAFLKNHFEDNDMFVSNPNNGFLKNLLRTGKRKKNKRSIPIKETDLIAVKIDKNYSDDYNALIFSYILKYDMESVGEDKYSRTYFFYDFIDLLEKYKKSFLKFDINGN